MYSLSIISISKIPVTCREWKSLIDDVNFNPIPHQKKKKKENLNFFFLFY